MAASAVTLAGVLGTIDQLQLQYVWALDRKDLPSWLTCFSPKASYACISRENEERGLPLCMMLDDCYERLQDRVKFIDEVWVGTYEDYTTRHFVQRMHISEIGDSSYAVESNFQIAYTTPLGQSALLAVGTYKDVITLAGSEARFLEKRAITDTVVLPRYLVYPL